MYAKHDLKMTRFENDHASPSIMIIERNRELRSDLADILELEGYAVAGVDRADEGLLLLKSFKVAPRLVIYAVDRNDISASQFIGAARDTATRVTSFLLMTDHTGNILPSDGHQSVFFIQKPFSVPGLLEIIQRALDQ